MGAKPGDHIVDREPSRFGVGEHARDEGAPPAVVVAWRVGLRRCGADERSDAAPRLDDAGALELRIHARDRVGVHTQVDGELAYGRQLVARAQAAGGDRRPQPAFELGIDRRRVASVNGEDGHLIDYTSSLIQVTEKTPRRPHAQLVLGRPGEAQNQAAPH